MLLHNTKQSIRSTVQYNPDNDEYTLKTNANDTWWNSDDVTFIFDAYSLPYGECSCLTMEVSLESFDESDSHASAGLMIRSSLSASASNASLVVRRNGVFFTFRVYNGKTTCTQRMDMPFGYHYPVKLKLVRQGYILLGSFRNGDEDQWRDFKPIEIKMGTEIYGGFNGYSYLRDYPITAVFRNYTAVLKNKEPLKVTAMPDHKNALTKDVLLLEQFDDGSATERPGSIDNPVWSGVTFANLAEITASDGSKRMVWHKDFMSGYHFTGNELWTDYALSMDLQFSENCVLGASNIVAIFVRQREWDIYGKFHYGIYLTNGDTIAICKSFASSEYSTIPLMSKTLPYLENIGDNNHIRIEALDNIITVYWNGAEVIRYVDEDALVIPFGKIGFMTKETSVYIGNITVTEIEDSLGGAYDNLVGGFWNEPAPDNFYYSFEAEDHTISEMPEAIPTSY